MKVITVINAKGGCGKSTIAMNLATALALDDNHVLLIDMDPQAQVSEWLQIGDALSWEGTIAAAFLGKARLHDLAHPTHIDNLWFIPSAEPLEDLGRNIPQYENYQAILAGLLQDLDPDSFDYVVIDSPNQISPIMRNAIYPADLFIVPFESTKAVKSYAGVYKLIHELRPENDFWCMHVLNNLRPSGLRSRVLERMHDEGIEIADVEIRNCGWLAQVDEHGGSIFHYRPSSKGAQDIAALKEAVVFTLNPVAKA